MWASIFLGAGAFYLPVFAKVAEYYIITLGPTVALALFYYDYYMKYIRGIDKYSRLTHPLGGS